MTTAPGGGQPADGDELARLEQLGTLLDGVSSRLGEVAQYGRQTRKLAIGLAASWLLDIALTVVVTLLSLSALNATTALHQSQLAACTISNQTRAEQITLWNYVIQLSGQNPDSNKAQLAQFEAFVKQTFKPVNCAQVYG